MPDETDDTSTDDSTSTDTTTDDTSTDTTDSTSTDDATSATETEGEAKWKAMARKHEKEAKAAKAEADKLRKATLSDQEKALDDAKNLGRSEATSEFATKLAAAELKAAGLSPDVIEDFDLSKFITEEGDVDADKVAAAAKRHKAATTSGSADGGPQGDTPTTPTLDEQIAAAQAKGDANEVIRLNSQKLALMGTP